MPNRTLSIDEPERTRKRDKLALLGVLALAFGLVAAGMSRPSPRRTHAETVDVPAAAQPTGRPAADRQTEASPEPASTVSAPSTPAAFTAAEAIHRQSEPAAPVDRTTFNGAGFSSPATPQYLDPRTDERMAGSVGVELHPEPVDPKSPAAVHAAKDAALMAKLGGSTATNAGE